MENQKQEELELKKKSLLLSQIDSVSRALDSMYRAQVSDSKIEKVSDILITLIEEL